MQRQKNKQSGFGLVEVVVSISIMVMVMIALNFVSRSALYNWENANNKTAAYNIIQQEIESLHNLRDSNSLTAGKKWDDGLVNSTKSTTIENKVYSEKITISDVPVSMGAGLKKKVVVEISWQERLGDRSLSGITYLTDWKARY